VSDIQLKGRDLLLALMSYNVAVNRQGAHEIVRYTSSGLDNTFNATYATQDLALRTSNSDAATQPPGRKDRLEAVYFCVTLLRLRALRE